MYVTYKNSIVKRFEKEYSWNEIHMYTYVRYPTISDFFYLLIYLYEPRRFKCQKEELKNLCNEMEAG